MKEILQKLKIGCWVEINTYSNLKLLGRFFAQEEHFLYAILDLGIFTAIPLRSIINIKLRTKNE